MKNENQVNFAKVSKASPGGRCIECGLQTTQVEKTEHQLKIVEVSKRVLVGVATSGQQIHANPKGGSHDFLWGRGEVLETHRRPSACRKGIFSINYSDPGTHNSY